MFRLYQWYLGQLVKRPLQTKAITASFTVGLGDFICQMGPERAKSWNARRTAQLALFGLLVNGPMLHGWYSLMDRFVRNPLWSPARNAITCMVIDQVFYAPVAVGLIFGTFHFVHNRTPEESLANYKKSMQTNYMLWPAAQLVNFRFVRPELRPAFVNLSLIHI